MMMMIIISNIIQCVLLQMQSISFFLRLFVCSSQMRCRVIEKSYPQSKENDEESSSRTRMFPPPIILPLLLIGIMLLMMMMIMCISRLVLLLNCN